MKQTGNVPADAEAAAARVVRVLWRLTHAIEKRSKRMEAALGVTFPQRTILRLIGAHPGISSGQVARALHADAGTVSTAVGRLERRGYVLRGADPRDARRVLLRLTAKGRKLDAPARGTVEEAVEGALLAGALGEAEVLETLLERLALSLEEDAPAPPVARGGRSKPRSAARG